MMSDPTATPHPHAVLLANIQRNLGALSALFERVNDTWQY